MSHSPGGYSTIHGLVDKQAKEKSYTFYFFFVAKLDPGNEKLN